MKPTLMLILALFLATTVFAQKQTGENVKVNDKRIYLIFDDGKLNFFTAQITPDGKEALQTNTNFLLTDNSINIYLKWINPLKYKLAWTDTTVVDPRDQALKDYITSLTGQFGSSVTDLNKNSSMQIIANTAVQKTKGVVAGKTPPTLTIPSFNSYQLTSVYVQLKQSGLLNASDITAINGLTDNLKKLDDNKTTDLAKKALADFNDMFNATDPTKVAGITDLVQQHVKEWQEAFKTISEGASAVSKSLTAIKLSDANADNLYKTGILVFIDKVNSKMATDQKIVAKLTPLIATMKASITDESTSYPGYFRVKNEAFADGKMVKTKLVITEYQFSADTYDFSKKSEAVSLALNIKKFDRVKIFVSTGVFYGSATLKGFGVANAGTQFTVTESDIKQNTAVTALFCNFAFGDSRYFSPLVQLGIDPTKKRPFLLAGAGFIIPSSSFAISGGPVWTWDQTLQKLTVGQTINSTTDLDKDVKYSFDVAPKGWYLGIQYNF